VSDLIHWAAAPRSMATQRNEVWRAAMLGMLGGAIAAVMPIQAFSRAFG
jgi:hypothetical protein